MKKLFILIVMCLVGMVLPQKMLADTVYSVSDLQITTSPSTKVEGTKVLIHCDNAGGFGAYLRNIASEAELSAIRGAAEIVFEGSFTADDISALNEKQCCTAKVVDMGDASFYRSYDIENSKYKYYAVGGDPNNVASVINSELETDGITPIEGDVVLFNGNDFYRYNGTTWEVTGNPSYPSLERLILYMSKDNAHPENGTLAMADGKFYKYNGTEWEEQPMVKDYSQVKFDNWANSVEEIITSKNVGKNDLMPDQLCNNCSKLKTLTLGSGNFALAGTVLGNGVNNLETVNIKKDVTSLSTGMFNAKNKLKTVDFEEPCQIKVLPSDVFNGTSIESITIPSSVEEIEGNAFHTCNSLKKVIIPENTSLNYIRTNAFQGCDNIEEVHVNVSPSTHPICCEYLAFGEYSLVGQTQSSGELDLNNTKMATLYFPKDDWDYYAGNWKLGMTCDDQAELNSIKDGCDPSKEGAQRENLAFSGNNTDLNSNYANENLANNKRGWLEGKSPANGWQQFAKTSTGIDIIVTKGKFYRTYSTPSALVKPDWMKIYRVKEFNDGFTSTSNPNSSAEAEAAMNLSTSGAKTEQLIITINGTDKTYTIIPENTGVIRVDERTSDALYYFLELERTSAANIYKNNPDAYEYPYSESGDKVNYMFPTKGSDVTIGPVEKDGSTITYRIFGLLKTKVSGVTPKFSRAKVGTTLGDHRAYLRLPAGVFHWKNEKVGSSQNATGDDVIVDENNTYAKVSLIFDDEIENLNGGIATEIVKAIEESETKDDAFYTLQGVKVLKPTAKGVYIHNGKKVLVK